MSDLLVDELRKVGTYMAQAPLPPVHNLVNIELIRDGGSLAVEFESDEFNRFILFFEIQISDTPRALSDYNEPILIDCDPRKRPADTDAAMHSVLCGPAVPVSWKGAREILNAIAHFAKGLTPLQDEWLRRMIDISAHDGHHPHS